MNNYPLAAENLINQPKMVPLYTKLKYREKISVVKKLMPNLYENSDYVIHYRNIKQCLNLGVNFENIHKDKNFNQSTWLKSYIEYNTTQRKNATNAFDKDFYKLLNNSVYGKMLENVSVHVHIRLLNNKKNSWKPLQSHHFIPIKYSMKI